MKESSARKWIAGFAAVSMSAIFVYVFINPDLSTALFFFSALSFFIFLYHNPSVLLASKLEDMDVFVEERNHQYFLWVSLAILMVIFVIDHYG